MKKLIAITIIISMSLAMIYIMNQSPVWLWALTFGVIGGAFLIVFVWSCCKLSAIATEREDEILLFEWRKGLTRGCLVRVNGRKMVVQSNDGRVCEVSDHNGSMFVLLADLWPVE